MYLTVFMIIPFFMVGTAYADTQSGNAIHQRFSTEKVENIRTDINKIIETIVTEDENLDEIAVFGTKLKEAQKEGDIELEIKVIQAFIKELSKYTLKD